MKSRRIKSSVVYAISLALVIILVLVTFRVYNLSKKEDILKEMEYYATDLSKYEVYYGDQRANEEGYIKKYTSSVSLNFDYALNFSEIVKGEEESLVKATLVVYAPNSETEIYRSDSEYLAEAKKVEYEDTKQFKENKNVYVDYQKYLNMYNNFKQETSIVSNAKILVEFYSSSIAYPKGLDKVTKNDSITYEIPLSDVTFNISKKSTISSDRKKVKKINKNNKKLKIYKTYIMVSIILIGVILLVDILRYIHDRSMKGLYYSKLDKVLKTYDNIIVNVKELPDIENKSIVNVTSFEELVDAQMEVRIPINFYENVKGKQSTFMIVSRDIAWIYTLEKEKKSKK